MKNSKNYTKEPIAFDSRTKIYFCKHLVNIGGEGYFIVVDKYYNKNTGIFESITRGCLYNNPQLKLFFNDLDFFYVSQSRFMIEVEINRNYVEIDMEKDKDYGLRLIENPFETKKNSYSENEEDYREMFNKLGLKLFKRRLLLFNKS